MNRFALLVASLALVACSGRSPWAGGSAKSFDPKPVASAPAPATPASAELNAVGGSEATVPVAEEARYSWQKKAATEDAPSTEAKALTGAPEDSNKCRILAVRPEHGLIAFAIKDKPADGSTLQLTKGDRAVLIRVIRSDENSTIADILSGQDLSKMPAFEISEEVLCGAPADLPIQ
jgi:hypothetical protein